MNQISFEYPAYFLALAVILSLLATAILYYQSRQFGDRPFGHKLILASLRTLAFFLLFVLLMNPVSRFFKNEVKKPELIVALDESLSMVAEDSSWISDYANLEEQFTSRLSEKYEIQKLSFGQSVRSENRLEFKDRASNYETLFDHIADAADYQQLKGIVALTDGIYNQGRNPVYHPLCNNVPIHTVFRGDSSQPKDLSVQRIYHQEMIFAGDRFGLELDIQASQCASENSSVKLQRWDGSQWLTLEEQKIEIQKAYFFETKTFVINADKPGIFKYRIQLTQIPGEKNLRNNIRDFYVEVIDSRKKVLLYALAPHPDLAAIKSAMEEHKNYEVKIVFSNENLNVDEKTQLVIFHNLPHATRDIQPVLTRLDALKISRAYILGTQTDISLFNQKQDILKISGNNLGSNESQALTDPRFNAFTMEEAYLNQINNFPPLNCPFGQYQLKPSAMVFLYQKIGKVDTEYPLLTFHEDQGVKTMILCGEGIWKWKLNNYIMQNRFDAFNALVSKSLQYSSVKEDRRRFKVIQSKKIYQESEQVIFNAEFFNESYELVNASDVVMKIKSGEGKEFDYNFSKKDRYYELNAGSLVEGDYVYSASTDWNGKKWTADGKFSVQAGNPELDHLVAQPGVLRNLSQISGGKAVQYSEWNILIEELLKDDSNKPVLYSTLEVKPLIDRKWMFVLIFLLLGLEWFLRRYWGSY